MFLPRGKPPFKQFGKKTPSQGSRSFANSGKRFGGEPGDGEVRVFRHLFEFLCGFPCFRSNFGQNPQCGGKNLAIVVCPSRGACRSRRCAEGKKCYGECAQKR